MSHLRMVCGVASLFASASIAHAGVVFYPTSDLFAPDREWVQSGPPVVFPDVFAPGVGITSNITLGGSTTPVAPGATGPISGNAHGDVVAPPVIPTPQAFVWPYAGVVTSTLTGTTVFPFTADIFAVEIVSLDLSPANAMVRESPTLASTGQALVGNVGMSGFIVLGQIDLYLELSIDGGQSWMPASGPVSLVLTQVPGPAAGLLAALGGLVCGCRRR